MSMGKLLLVVAFVFHGFYANARICEERHASNSIEYLEKALRGCTVVVGNLKIVLMDQPWNKPSDFDNVTFPELTEITGFLLLYRVFAVTSIGKLFPNLTVIRGDTLLANYALVLHDLPNLQEIGLNNLQHVGRGLTRIAKCPHLCFVGTIDWSIIGGPSHRVHYFNANKGDCAFCPKHCNGLCWNYNSCQITPPEECDTECLGCTKSNPNQCKACRSLYLNEGKCVTQCPKNKLRNPETRTCVTQQECSSISTGPWWAFQGECIRKCPEGYAQVLEAEGWCTSCGDNCKTECAGGIIDHLNAAEYFRNCTHINGSLTISVATTSEANELEDGLGKVKEIEGYLEVRRSHAISSLNFLKNLKVIRGRKLLNGQYALIAFGNENLRRLWDWNNFTLKIETGTIYFHYNPALCLSEIDKLVDVAGVPNNYTFADVSFYSNGDRTVCRHIDLEINVTDLTPTGANFAWKDFPVEAYDVVVGYTLFIVEDRFGNITQSYGRDECFEDSWVATFVTNTSCSIHSLSPYTQYAFYMQVYTTSPASAGLTAIQHFITLSGEPEPPTNIRVILSTTDSIILSWDPPLYPAGVLTHYRITFYLQEDDPQLLIQRNYCFYPHRFVSKAFEETKEEKEGEEEEPLEIWINSTCCKKQNWQEWKRFKRSDSWFSVTAQLRIDANSTTYELKQLQHFKIYVLLLAACNDLPACSSPILIYQRTQPKEEADDIPPGVNVVLNNSDVFVRWLEPTSPNSVILSYVVELKKTDLENSTTTSQCITRQDYAKAGYGFTMTNLPPGNYSLTVKAVSLAGPGRASEVLELKIPFPETAGSMLPYFITFTVIFVTIAFGLFYYYYRVKNKNWKLFANSSSAESLYADDQYELLREDVEVDVPMATDQGVFGTIHNGFIKSQNRPCTVKFAQNYSNKRELSRFLKEASATMKMSNSYHVVSLLGIVSKEQPALVVMELMAWGDLKSFLKRSKDSETKLTNAEMYRMAAEIADGVMYLSSKNFIHRDLAARNCMVSAGHTVKIINFGISQDLYKTDYFKKENGDVIPVRWMAPESLADGIFTVDSNVWSYGIILWEIVTLAEQPYKNLSDEDVTRYVIGQKVLEPPTDCPDLLYEMMVACWRWRPKHRPVIANLLKQLQCNIRKDFRLVSFYHSREAAEYKESAKNREYNLPARKIPLLDERQTVRWKKKDDDILLCPEEQHQSQNLPSTSGHT